MNGHEEPKIGLERFDPQRAEDAIQHQARNRKLRDRKVDQFVREMLANRWNNTGVVRFTEDGKMWDGQHRMAAVVKSKTVQRFVVIYEDVHEADPANPLDSLDAFLSIDTGTKRTFGDALSIAGMVNAKTLASATKWLWQYRNEQIISSTVMPSHVELMEILRENRNLTESIAPTREACYLLKVPAGMGTCLHYEMASLDSDSADEFWRMLGKGMAEESGNPVYTLRRKLEQNAANRSAKLPTPMMAAYIIKSWNAYVQGEKMFINRWTRGGVNREEFPVIEGPGDDATPFADA